MKDNEGDWGKRKKISRNETAMPLIFTSVFCLYQTKKRWKNNPDPRTLLGVLKLIKKEQQSTYTSEQGPATNYSSSHKMCTQTRWELLAEHTSGDLL